MIVKNKIAQLLNGKIHWIFETEENLTQVQSRFAPDIIFVDISNTDYKEGWNWDSIKGVATAPVKITPELTTEEKLTELQEEYDAYITKLAQDYAVALAQGNTVIATDIQSEMANVLEQYAADKETLKE